LSQNKLEGAEYLKEFTELQVWNGPHTTEVPLKEIFFKLFNPEIMKEDETTFRLESSRINVSRLEGRIEVKLVVNWSEGFPDKSKYFKNVIVFKSGTIPANPEFLI
jgi:hypothetical protein